MLYFLLLRSKSKVNLVINRKLFIYSSKSIFKIIPWGVIGFGNSHKSQVRWITGMTGIFGKNAVWGSALSWCKNQKCFYKSRFFLRMTSRERHNTENTTEENCQHNLVFERVFGAIVLVLYRLWYHIHVIIRNNAFKKVLIVRNWVFVARHLTLVVVQSVPRHQAFYQRHSVTFWTFPRSKFNSANKI